MPLSRNDLIHMAVDRYFLACNTGDLATVMTTFAPDCVVSFSSAEFEYRGLEALETHMEEFRDTFATIDFHDFVPVVDTVAQTIAVQFEVKLVDHQDNAQVMQNCNFFHVNGDGFFDSITIYNSAPLDQGFEAGSS